MFYVASVFTLVLVSSGIFLCLRSKRNRPSMVNIVPLDTYDEARCCCIILSKTKFVRAVSVLQENVTLSLCLLVLLILFLNFLPSIESPLLLYFKHFSLPFLAINLTRLASSIILIIDLLYIIIWILYRNAIYRKPGDHLILVILEFISFASTFFYDDPLLSLVWLIPIILYLWRSHFSYI